ncbi:aminopeptidase Y [Diaporthe sp. PMI_573]|nr:aminopeptidase Y [Diaporthaceae sp. PMI_573]
MMKLTRVPTLSFALLLSNTAVGQKPVVDSATLQADIVSDNLRADLVAFDEIATANGGNRAFGYPGYDASVDFVWSKISQLDGVRAWKQDFPAVWSRDSGANLTVNGVRYEAFPVYTSPYTPTGGLTADVVVGPVGSAGCDIASYADLDVTDKIVLVEAGDCPGVRRGFLDGKVVAAARSGALATIIYNNVTTRETSAGLSRSDPNDIPAVFINNAPGLELKGRIETGEIVNATVVSAEITDTRMTQNVFAETVDGDPENTIILGAHLDSVVSGAGINDNASGSTLLLELVTALAKYTTKNRVRFAWWGAEERGLLGSRYYVNNLPAEESARILAYLNFDMVSRGYFGVFDGDGSTHGAAAPPGSGAIEQLFAEDFASKGLVVTPAKFTNGSDYASFWQVLNKPVGGLHTGTGAEQDPCYHSPCDNIRNPNITTLTINTKAAAHVLSILSTNGTEIIP